MIKKKKADITYVDEENGGNVKTKTLKAKLQACQKEKEDYLVQLQRARADLVNFRRRQEEAMAKFKTIGDAALIREFLPVLDSLEAGAQKDDGVKKIKDQFDAILKQRGVKEIETIGKDFDPNFHEAVMQVESDQEAGIIVEEVQKGFILENFVIRPSKVKIAK